jgi:hypothetical protein
VRGGGGLSIAFVGGLSVGRRRRLVSGALWAVRLSGVRVGSSGGWRSCIRFGRSWASVRCSSVRGFLGCCCAALVCWASSGAAPVALSLTPDFS